MPPQHCGMLVRTSGAILGWLAARMEVFFLPVRIVSILAVATLDVLGTEAACWREDVDPARVAEKLVPLLVVLLADQASATPG